MVAGMTIARIFHSANRTYVLYRKEISRNSLLDPPGGYGSVSRFWLSGAYLKFAALLLGFPGGVRGAPVNFTGVSLRGVPRN